MNCSLLVALGLVCLAGCAEEGPPGPQGPQGPEGPRGPGPTDAALVSVSPTRIFTGRTTTVVVSGVNTQFDDGWTVDVPLGGISTQLVGVASPDALVAEITVPPESAPERRDVTVSSENTGLVLEGALDVVPPIATTFRGPTAHGAVVAMHLVELDPLTPIGPGAGLGTLPTLVMDPLRWTFRTTGAYQLEGLVLLSRAAEPGPITVLLDRTGDEQADDLQPDAFVLSSSTAINLTDQPTAGFVTADAPTRYTLGLQRDRMVTLTLTNVADTLDPGLVVIGPGGTAANVLGAGGTRASFCTPAEGNNEVVVYDASGTPGPDAGFTISLTQTDCIRSIEVEPNDDLATSTDVGELPAAVGGHLDDPTDVDVFRVTLDSRRALQVETAPGEGGDVLDTTLEVVGVSQPTGEDAINDDAEAGRIPLSRVQTTPLDPGTYVIVVRLARGRGGAYTLLVR